MASRRLISLIIVLTTAGAFAADIANFDDLSLDPNSYWNGLDDSGGFVSGSANFNNFYDPNWGSWGGFAYSNIKDPCSEGWSAQFNCITGVAQSGDNYAVGYVDTYNRITPTMVIDTEGVLGGVYVTNSNFAYYSMLNGDMFAKKFGGETGDDPDWFVLTITGKDDNDVPTGTVDFYLADYRFGDNSHDYIVNTWEYVNLTSLGAVKSLEFSLNSSDVGPWGINTPLYFVMDTVITPLERAVQNIKEAIAAKNETLAAIDTALAKERAAIHALNALLVSGEPNGLEAIDIYKAKLKTRLAIICERISRRRLIKSIDKLEDVLVILTGEGGQQDWFDDDKLRDKYERMVADINGDGVINILDFAIMSQHWLETYKIEK